VKPVFAYRLVGLAALALAAGVIALAATRGSSHSRQPALPASAPAPGGGWYRALASSQPLVTKTRRTVCGHTLGAKTVGVAHPVLPCNVRIYIEFGGKQVLTAVIDRGPYTGGREFAFTHALAEAIGLHGTQPIKWRFATANAK
jgi:hypothetical protein